MAGDKDESDFLGYWLTGLLVYWFICLFVYLFYYFLYISVLISTNDAVRRGLNSLRSGTVSAR